MNPSWKTFQALSASARLLLLSSVILLTACEKPTASNASDGPRGAEAVKVELAAARLGEQVRAWSAVGSLQANESVTIRPEIGGRIARLGFEEGQQVAHGAVLFGLDDSVFVAQQAEARARLSLSTRNAQRAEELFARGLISPSDRDTALAAREVDAAALRLAAAQAAKTSIQAPFAGRAGLRQASVGDYVIPGQDLVVIEDLARIKLEFRLPELALSDVREGQVVRVELDAYPGERFDARLYALDSRVASDTRSIGARAVLDNADGRLRPGLFARVNLVVERRLDALLIPEQAIISRGASAFVYVVEDGRASEREIQLGQRGDGQVEVRSGLAAGQQVVVSGLQRLSDGASVQAQAPAAKAAP